MAQFEKKGFLAQLTDSVEYRVDRTMTVTNGGGNTPFWLTSNRYGLSGVRHSSWHYRLGAFRDTERDADRNWRVGYGADLVLAHRYTSDFIIQQLYFDLGYRNVRLSIGAKERPASLKNNELSSGSLTFGINSRPIPEARFEVPEYISLFGGKKVIWVRGHFGYGMLTDGNWQGTFARKSSSRYTKGVLYHSKSAFMKIGNEQLFPLTLEGGIELAATFGGRYYRGDGYSTSLYGGLKDFGEIIFTSGSDPGETEYKNAKGNTLGSWLLSLDWHGNGWGARAYYDHFFEDHSGLFYANLDYDGLYGLEIKLPANRVVGNLVYEYVYTKYQSGALYHDHTSTIKDDVFGRDNYYNHNLYAGWQHWGMGAGSPLFLSPLYNSDNALTFKSNRFAAHHFGLSGNPLTSLHYRMLFTYSKQYGTYAEPFDDIKRQRSFLAELTWSPRSILRRKGRNWALSAAYAYDHGTHTGNNSGFMFSIKKSGFFGR